jgi:hypothetical protein
LKLRECSAPSARAQSGKLFTRKVDDQLYTQPLVLTGLSTHGGVHDVVYATTGNNSVHAFNANDAMGQTRPTYTVVAVGRNRVSLASAPMKFGGPIRKTRPEEN